MFFIFNHYHYHYHGEYPKEVCLEVYAEPASGTVADVCHSRGNGSSRGYLEGIGGGNHKKERNTVEDGGWVAADAGGQVGVPGSSSPC